MRNEVSETASKRKKKKLLTSVCWTNLATTESTHYINKAIKKGKNISGDGDTRHTIVRPARLSSSTAISAIQLN